MFYEAGAVAVDFKSRALTDRTDPQAEHIAAISPQRSERTMAGLD
jgi:hypothetical protein